jgi:hypothetical protein
VVINSLNRRVHRRQLRGAETLAAVHRARSAVVVAGRAHATPRCGLLTPSISWRSRSDPGAITRVARRHKRSAARGRAEALPIAPSSGVGGRAFRFMAEARPQQDRHRTARRIGTGATCAPTRAISSRAGSARSVSDRAPARGRRVT